MNKLSNEEIIRYNRQIVLQGFDFEKQEKLKSSHVLIVGLGGLGCAAAPYLASSGIGYLTILDFDTISLSNLQRQILYSDTKIGIPKVNVAAQKLKTINPYCNIEIINEQLNETSFSCLISNHDAVVDCTDNIRAREQINRLCFQHRVPLISSAAIRMEGLLSVFTWKPGEPCYRCISRLFNEYELNCLETGIIAPLVGVLGSMQALETLKVLTKFGKTLNARLLIYDAMIMELYTVKIIQDIYCEVCGTCNQ
ncbi:molybdopterin-synthase adenylyltransferase MoeB [Pantoea sp. Aalb]|uniref:molybdopterin-synthase adenylyltransferase MoeB n=1 Tax=Pantoea sp. Aalb TaxID=2576762 RepID=UPI001328856A|nr:molybdopterin-synthase adenylyltransferase MoeB [Pantoea sp. Aalb]MXP67506.1 molybdopterin-synthase adenylyltransferase MoeB [Pantoea sp. Aalb]